MLQNLKVCYIIAAFELTVFRICYSRLLTFLPVKYEVYHENKEVFDMSLFPGQSDDGITSNKYHFTQNLLRRKLFVTPTHVRYFGKAYQIKIMTFCSDYDLPEGNTVI